jgi:hypothetical protein
MCHIEIIYICTLDQINRIGDTPREVVWDDQQDEDKREGKLLQMNGKRRLIKIM